MGPRWGHRGTGSQRPSPGPLRVRGSAWSDCPPFPQYRPKPEETRAQASDCSPGDRHLPRSHAHVQGLPEHGGRGASRIFVRGFLSKDTW